MDNKKVLKVVFSALVFASILIGAGAVYSHGVIGTMVMSVIAFVYAAIQVKSLGK